MRIVFLIFYVSTETHPSNTDALLCFLYGLRMDLSASGYLMAIPFLLWIAFQFNLLKEKSIHYINYILITLTIGIAIGNIALYGEWRNTINYRALTYLLYPSELIAFAGAKLITLGILGISAFTFLFIFLYKKLAAITLEAKRHLGYQCLAISFCFFTFIRGGFQVTPMNESAAVFSTNSFYNNAATNSLWYLTNSVINSVQQKNIYAKMPQDLAQKITNKINNTSGSHISILKTTKPNIVFIILESWTAGIILSLGGDSGVTPKFEELCQEGILFTQAYGSGYRTDVGLAAILSGYPGQPNNSIMAIPSKSNSLPFIVKNLNKKGYSNSFYYGGDIEFANMKNYLINGGFTKIIDRNNFTKSQSNGKWGAHDEYVFDKQLQELKKEKQPFFSCLLTLSTHEPFEVPISAKFPGNDNQSKFCNAAFYTDQCLYNYFTKAKKEPWYQNTLFVLCADHGRYLEGSISADSTNSKQIAMMVLGGALADSLKGKQINFPVGQQDIAATILNQLGLSADDYKFSRDIFNTGYQPFAYYATENVVGWVTTKGGHGYSHHKPLSKDSAEIEAKAYLQILYQDFLDR